VSFKLLLLDGKELSLGLCADGQINLLEKLGDLQGLKLVLLLLVLVE